jgi:hypothetical protein
MKTAPLPSHQIDKFSILLSRMNFYNSLDESFKKIIENQEIEHQKLVISLIKKKRESEINEEDIDADFSSNK